MAIVGGQTLIARAAHICNQLDFLDYALLTTDDPQMAEEGIKNGLQAPFLRPVELSSDTALSIDVWRHAWLNVEQQLGSEIELSVLLEPTSPLRTPKDVEDCLQLLLESEADTAVTVSSTPGHFTPQKTLQINSGNRLEFFHQSGASHSLRQSIPKYFHRNGACYATRRKWLMNSTEIIGENTVAVVINRPMVNIDDPIEIELAEWFLKRGANENV